MHINMKQPTIDTLPRYVHMVPVSYLGNYFFYSVVSPISKTHGIHDTFYYCIVTVHEICELSIMNCYLPDPPPPLL